MDIDFLEPGGALKGNLFSSLIITRDRESIKRSANEVVYPFLIEQWVGSGGHGSVYRAKRIDGKFEQTVALKIIEHSGAELGSFSRECNILAKLEHANIARIIDAGVSENQFYWYAMEFCSGLALDEALEQYDFDCNKWLSILSTICNATHFAHQHGVIHGDIKPANVIVDKQGQVKLVDFGVANIVGESTIVNAMSLAFASPEQAMRKSLTTRSDVYQLGLLILELIAVANKQSHNKSVLTCLECIAAKCLQPLPENRYQSAEAVGQDLKSVKQLTRPQYTDIPLSAVWGLRLKKYHRHGTLGILLLILASLLYQDLSDALLKEKTRSNLAAHREDIKSKYLGNIFQQIKNEFDGKKMREQLDRASEVSLDAFKGDPSDELVVKETLASAYMDIRIFDKAARLFENVTQSSHFPQSFDEKAQLEILLKQTKVYLDLNEPKLAQTTFERISPLKQYAIPLSDLEALYLLIDSLIEETKNGKLQSSRKLINSATRFAEHPNNAGRFTAELFRVTSYHFEGQAQWRDATRFGELALESNRLLFGDLSAITQDNVRDVIWYKIQEGKVSEAFNLIETQKHTIENRLGENSLDYLRLLGVEGNALYKLERFDEAVAVFSKAVDLFYKGNFHDLRYQGLMHHHLASALMESKQWKAAIDQYMRSIEIRRETYFGDTTAIVPAHFSIALAYCELSKLEEGNRWMSVGLELQKQTPFPDVTWLNEATLEYASCLRRKPSSMLQQTLLKDSFAILVTEKLTSEQKATLAALTLGH